MYQCEGFLSCDSLWAAGDETVGSRKDPLLRYDGGTTNMAVGQEVKADLPWPLPQLGVLSSNNAVQLIGPCAAVWHLTEKIMREESRQMAECKVLAETGMYDQREKKKKSEN